MRGYNVRAVVRSETSFKSILDKFPEYASSKLSYVVVPDITKPEAYKDAFEGVVGVLHSRLLHLWT